MVDSITRAEAGVPPKAAEGLTVHRKGVTILPLVWTRRIVDAGRMRAMDHDRLFKELLTTFFVEFIELFFPELAAYLERDSIEFLDKEVFTDVTHGERHEADIVAKARFRGKDLGFLIHVEPQARHQQVFGRRMFTYFRDSTRSTTCRYIRSHCSHMGRRGSPNRASIGSNSPT